MSNNIPPPFMPFSDEEGYYVRDPNAVLVRTDAEFRAFAAHLLALAEGLEAVNAALSPEQQVLVQQVTNRFADVQSDTKGLLALVRELATYNILLTKQRQSARAAYDAGWKDRYEDILSQLHPTDQAMLHWILRHLDAADSSDETAF